MPACLPDCSIARLLDCSIAHSIFEACPHQA